MISTKRALTNVPTLIVPYTPIRSVCIEQELAVHIFLEKWKWHKALNENVSVSNIWSYTCILESSGENLMGLVYPLMAFKDIV